MRPACLEIGISEETYIRLILLTTLAVRTPLVMRDWGPNSVDALLKSYNLHFQQQLPWMKLYKQVFQLGSVSCHKMTYPDGEFELPSPRASHSLNFVSDCLVLFAGGSEGVSYALQIFLLRIAETLDVEIKRWAAGKEGNLRALLSTLQYERANGIGWGGPSKSNGKSMDQLLLKCPIARELWDLLLCLFGVYWVMPNSGTAMLASWKGRERNRRIFEGCEQNVAKQNVVSILGYRILTADNLMRRGYQLAGWCCMCRRDGETINHLLIHCELAYGLWSFVFWKFGTLWVLSGCVLDLFFGWYNGLGKLHSKVWNMVPPYLLWTLWRERNSRIFENTERMDSQLQELFSNTLYDWATAWGYSRSDSVTSFLDSLHISSYISTL
uniref:Reverse transcriptase zinc-binding domain-containing protein n=1 Tax=Fagus sylvatica TaxID=28930 RepID=A0A2N9ECT1_FAGSY